ncbi:TrkA-N domain-containing protein [Lentzea albidocapillata subsp. violacea]|uniref:TrkA-N domain-containing protein n=1 Tax=Lentzea albidocapillata subsp. violacea TaxID=128104 RepID=A0A1G9F5W9_9PSEU|nr:NAD(P)-binding protein [Lentzea albidocapillata]SDK83720.1 TrkA-N domain-containing protein [Lentzea albidocapillata subsp. violacea]
MTDHILVIGYGDAGRRALNSVLASQPDARLTVLDTDYLAVAEASANGATAVLGDGRDRCALDEAAADIADRVIIAVPDDLNAFLITRAVRPLNPDTVIVAIIREPENHTIFTSDGIVSIHLRQLDDRQT